MLDAIDNYESQLSHNSTGGSIGVIQSDPAADSEEVSQSVNSTINVSSDAVPSSNLKRAEGKWLKDGKFGTSQERQYQVMEDKLLVRQIFVMLYPKSISKNVFNWIFIHSILLHKLSI